MYVQDEILRVLKEKLLGDGEWNRDLKVYTSWERLEFLIVRVEILLIILFILL